MMIGGMIIYRSGEVDHLEERVLVKVHKLVEPLAEDAEFLPLSNLIKKMSTMST